MGTCYQSEQLKGLIFCKIILKKKMRNFVAFLAIGIMVCQAFGYPAPVNGYPAPVNGYPAPANGYPAPVNGYPAPVNRYPAPANGHPGPVNGYPAPANGYPNPGNGLVNRYQGLPPVLGPPGLPGPLPRNGHFQQFL